MATTNNAFMEEHKDFVLKLKFVGEGDTSQVRRIRLPRVLDRHGQLSYDELCGLAISFVIPENPANASDFEVKLSYKDVDDDTIVIGSSEELLDAIDQFSEQRVLRISAEVKRFRKANALQPPSPASSPETHPPSQASQDAHAGTEGSGNDAGVNATTRNHSEPVPAVPVLQNVVESVVNIILNAAVAINGRQGSQPATSLPGPVFYTPEGVPAEVAESGAADQSPQQEPVTPSIPSEASQSKPEEAKETVDETSTSAPATEATENVEEELSFIHGRHTCDICLTTPIIGTRFHAQNMSDYDLCEKCHSNYSGTEIQFEAVELERDRSLQARWHRRRQRQNSARGPGARGSHSFGRKGWGPPHRRGDTQPPPSFPPPPPTGLLGPRNRGRPGPLFGPPHGPRYGPPHPRYGHEPPFRPPHHQLGHPPFGPPPHLPRGLPPAPGSDLAMEEAIRRSLLENVAAKPEPSAEVSPPPAPVMDEEAPSNAEEAGLLKPAPQPSAPLEEETRSLSSIGSATSASDAEEAKVETVEDENGEEGEEGDDEQNGGDVMDIDKPRVEGPSFSSDAAGSGDVAVSLGETLDKCAEAIDAMVLELGRTGSESTHSSFVGVSNVGDEETSVEAKETEKDAGDKESTAEAEVTEGATIVESANPEDTSNIEDTQVDGGGGWQVVNVDQQTSSDEDIARAAQMIGSALFNSDMRSSHEMMSTLTAGSSRAGGEASFASSVPTDLPSVSSLSSAQLDRWALQLSQLHDMGIDNDTRCVDILERLAAANIGCGNDDEEVSVQKVLDEMWKN